ncbi:retrovirus-related pol polyprotein from transposon TNT 1-94, partial [Tanacetum coccineum]
DVVFDGAFGGVGDEEVVVGEGVVVTSSSLDMLTNSCLGGIMVSLIFLEGLDEEVLVDFMIEWCEEDEDDDRNDEAGMESTLQHMAKIQEISPRKSSSSIGHPLEQADFSNIYDLLLEECVSKDVTCSYLHSLSDLNAYTELQCLYLHKVKECECLALKLSKQTESVNNEVHNKLLKSYAKLEKHSISLELFFFFSTSIFLLQQCKNQMKTYPVCKENASIVFSNVFRKEREQYHEIQDLKAQMQDKNMVINELKKLILVTKGKSVETQFDKPSVVRQPNAQRIPKPSVLGKPTPFSNSPEMRSFQTNKSVNKNNASDGLFKPVTQQNLPQKRNQAVRNTNVLKPGMFRIASTTTQTRTPQLPHASRNTNPHMSKSSGVIHTTSVSRPQLKCYQVKDKVVPNNSQVKFQKKEVEDHHRISSISKKTKSVTACNDSSNSRTSNVNAVCAECGKCVFNSNHDACVSRYLKDVNARTKKPNVVPISASKPKRKANKSVATPHKKTVASDTTIQKSKSYYKELYENTNQEWKWWIAKRCPSGYTWTQKPLRTKKIWMPKIRKNDVSSNISPTIDIVSRITNIVQLILFIVDSGCTKHMTGNLKLLCNFVEKFLGTVRFGNDQFAPILGYGDLIQGNVTIKRVYYVEGLNHNLFSVGQFCDADLEVAFRKSTCFVRDLQGNDLLTGSRGSDLYTISLQETTSSTPICFMAKASPTQAWLWHRRLSHLNFDYITLLSKKDVVNGLPKLKYVKDQLCSSCEMNASFASINGKKYILVIVDDYSRYTWTLFLRSKDETPEVLKDFLTMIQRNLQAQVITVRTDRGTEFLNKTLHAYFKEEGIEHQTSTVNRPRSCKTTDIRFMTTLTPMPPRQNVVPTAENRFVTGSSQKVRLIQIIQKKSTYSSKRLIWIKASSKSLISELSCRCLDTAKSIILRDTVLGEKLVIGCPKKQKLMHCNVFSRGIVNSCVSKLWQSAPASEKHSDDTVLVVIQMTNGNPSSVIIQTSTAEGKDMKKVDRGITMINHTQAEAMRILTNVLYWRHQSILQEPFIDLLIDFVTKTVHAARSPMLGLYQAIELEEEGFNVYFEGGLRSDEHFNAQDYWLSISQEENLGLSRSHTSTIKNPILRVIHKMITYGICQRTTRYQGVFEHMAGVYSVPLQGAYKPDGYAQPQYDQYYQQYPPPPPQYQQQQQDDDE